MLDACRRLKLFEDDGPILPLYRNRQNVHRIFLKPRRIFIFVVVVFTILGLSTLIAKPLHFNAESEASWLVLNNFGPRGQRGLAAVIFQNCRITLGLLLLAVDLIPRGPA
jgi:hypothetical protein